MSDLRERLSLAFRSRPKKGVTGVTRVTVTSATPSKSQSYNGYNSYASGSREPQGGAVEDVVASEACLETFMERAASAENEGGLCRVHAELLAVLETAPFGPEHDRVAIIAVVAMHLDHLAATARVMDRETLSTARGTPRSGKPLTASPIHPDPERMIDPAETAAGQGGTPRYCSKAVEAGKFEPGDGEKSHPRNPTSSIVAIDDDLAIPYFLDRAKNPRFRDC